MGIQRVALVFDHRARPDTTGVYCRRALGELVDVEHVLPSELSRLPGRRFDLYLNVDDGLAYRWPSELHPCAWWAIDTHLHFDWCLTKARGFDFVFAAQRDGAERLRAEGIETALWLPLACDPEIHRPHEIPKQYDVGFVGNLFPGQRSELLARIRGHCLNTFIGQRYFEEMAQTYSACRMVFNRSIKNDVNMRVFEALGCGSMLITNDLSENGLADLFKDGEHLATYASSEELLDKLDYYLKKEHTRERIAAAGRAEAIGKHTYRNRMEQILRCVDKGQESLPLSVAPRCVMPQAGHESSYFEFSRPELLAMVPDSARKVLDIGCGAGRLGEALKARQLAHVTGIECVEEAAKAAQERLDDVLIGDVEQLELDFQPGSFDAIICGDVLEHLRDPARLLRRARRWLASGGSLITSIPNVRHHTVVRALLSGNWTYETAGLLDQDHVHFFTRREIEKMFFRAGFTIADLQSVPGPGDEGLNRIRRPDEVRVGRLHIAGMKSSEADEFYTYQYLLHAKPQVDNDYGLTSIVILTFNQLEFTRECLESLRRFTDEPYELIIVDNGSTDGTVPYLQGLAGIRLLLNPENRGFPAAANEGIQAAIGQQVLLLNNDTILTTGWLTRLLRGLYSDPAIGLVGPCSNWVSGPQCVEADYEQIADLDGFAWDWGKRHDGVLENSDRLVGFCMLIRRSVIDSVGLLDERFGIGCFEDDDFCRRATAQGYRAVIVRDAFVHHFGSRTFLGSGLDFGAVLSANEQIYREKWGEVAIQDEEAPLRNSQPHDQISVPAHRGLSATMAPGGGLVLKPAEVFLSLCMIVRDSSRTLPECLESIKPWVDEMVIVDTGSTDSTPGIVEQYGGRLFHFPWCDDFSAARNESLRHARGQWIFWMDSDDTIPAECGRALKAVAKGTEDPSILGYVVQVHCPGGRDDADGNLTVVDHVKLIRNLPHLRFDGRIHEQILPAIRRVGGELGWTELYVVHSGSDQTPEAQERKRRRDLHLLHLELRERPEHPFTLFNLGMTYADANRFEEAESFLKRGIARSAPQESHLRKAYALLMHSQMELGRLDQAESTCTEGLKLFPEDSELKFRQGVLLHKLGRPTEAAEAYRAVLVLDEGLHFRSIDPGIKGFKARQNLAVVLTELGDLKGAEEQWRCIVKERPHYRDGWQGLAEVLMLQGNLKNAKRLCQELSKDKYLREEGLILKGRIASLEGNLVKARAAFQRAVKMNAKSLDALQALCQFLFEHGDPGESERSLSELIRLAPEDGSAYHNLGTVYLQTGRHQEAIRAYRQSLRHRPASGPTYVQLGYALKENGQLEEAVTAWEQALIQDPTDHRAREAIEQVMTAGIAR